ncbi:hypothetical protein FDECE_11593 [Fusarium decemcellulare]|nr:hypothetical protein FDECE_11593 [Fusarium decemcellulare]
MTKSVFITGANSGVGLASTKLFLPETFHPAVAGAIGKFGKIDVLVNNAGYAQYGVLEQLDVDAIRRNFEVNVFGMALPGLRRRVSTTLTAEQTGTMALIKEFIPHLRATSRAESPSRIIYVGSGGGHFGLPLIGPYGASKAAMNIFMESLVYEMEGVEPPIQVKLVCPHGGITETNFGQTSMQFAGLDKMTTEVQQRYGPFIERTLQRFGAMRGQSMAAPEAAKTVWTAATEDSTKLRYFVGPRDGGKNLRRRMMLDGQADADEADKRYMDEMRATFL